MIVEEYRFNWKTFEEEMPESYKSFLVCSPKEKIKNAFWAFLTRDKKSIHALDLKQDYYVSRCKKWLWCYDKNIELVVG